MTDAERDEDLLRYISDSITLIAQYTGGGEEAFRRELTARHLDIPWRAIYGFRNVAAHGYLGLDVGRVWTTVQDSLPALHSVVTEELRRSENA